MLWRLATWRQDGRIHKEYPFHPHANDSVLIVPCKTLSFAESMPGCGLLPFSKKRVLTKKGENKATWKPDQAYMPDSIISPTGRKNLAEGVGVYYPGVWQELGLKEKKTTEEWAKKMVIVDQISR